MNTENKSKNTIEKSEYATKYIFRERGITLIDSGFIMEEQHPDWVANIVPVTKKNGRSKFALIFVI